MKKRLQGLIAGVLIGAVITGGVAFSKQLTEIAELYYNNIKIFIDGGEITPKDANGNPAEPFTVNGTTYLPVRAIANAFGKDVVWDGATQSIYIGKKDYTKPDIYLSKIQYNDYKEAYGGNDFTVINGTVEDYSGNIYKNGIILYSDGGQFADDIDKAAVKISYPLNSQYKKLTGTVLLPKKYNLSTWGERNNISNGATNVWIYGDDELLHKITYLTSSLPFKLDLDVTGVNQLTIKVQADGTSRCTFADMALYK